MGVTPSTLYTNGLVLKANSSDSIASSNPIGLNDILSDALSLSQSSAQTVTGPLTFSGNITFSAASLGHVTIVSSAGPYAVAAADRYIVVTYAGGAMSITLPASPVAGRLISVKDGVGGASVRNITVTGSQTIDGIAGGTGIVLSQNYGSADLLYSGSVWLIL